MSRPTGRSSTRIATSTMTIWTTDTAARSGGAERPAGGPNPDVGHGACPMLPHRGQRLLGEPLRPMKWVFIIETWYKPAARGTSSSGFRAIRVGIVPCPQRARSFRSSIHTTTARRSRRRSRWPAKFAAQRLGLFSSRATRRPRPAGSGMHASPLEPARLVARALQDVETALRRQQAVGAKPRHRMDLAVNGSRTAVTANPGVFGGRRLDRGWVPPERRPR